MFVTLAVNCTFPPAATGLPATEMLSTLTFIAAIAPSGNASTPTSQSSATR
jgi:hypothetical protein